MKSEPWKFNIKYVRFQGPLWLFLAFSLQVFVMLQQKFWILKIWEWLCII